MPLEKIEYNEQAKNIINRELQDLKLREKLVMSKYPVIKKCINKRNVVVEGEANQAFFQGKKKRRPTEKLLKNSINSL